MKNKITLLIMSKKGLNVLKAIIKKKITYNIDFVVSSPDLKVKNDFFEEIKILCNNNNIKFYSKNDDFKIVTTFIIAISWKWIIKTNKDQKLIVLHDSILPKYRGFIPLVNSLINKEPKIGVTALFATKKFDEGEIITQKAIKIKYPIKIIEAINLISQLYIKIIIYIFNNLDNLISAKQNPNQATYSVWLDDEDYIIDWNKDADYIKRFIDSVGFPYSGAKTYLKDEPITIISAEVVEDIVIENRHVGKVIFHEDKFPIVICGEGLLKIKEILNENQESILPLKKFRTRFQ